MLSLDIKTSKNDIQVEATAKGHDDDDNERSDEFSKKSAGSLSGRSPILQRAKTKAYPYVVTMVNWTIEMVIMFSIIVVYSAMTNNPPKIGKSPAAYPFFPKNGLVKDWYRGELHKAVHDARSTEFMFVMFYAPWDAESQNARKEFLMAAEYLREEYTFVAVNCWQPESECKSQYTKVYKWPIMIVYPIHGRGIQYNGPLIGAHIIRFLKNVKKPYVRLKDLSKLVAEHDAVVVGKMNTLSGSADFAVFYRVCLMMLEKDPFREIALAVDSQPELTDDYYYSTPYIYLHMWNETLVYPTHSDEPWKAENIVKWIFRHLHHVSSWLSLKGSKSAYLSNYIRLGPTLILFTPRNPIAHHNDYYSMLKEVAYEYYNCDKNDMVALRAKRVRVRRITNYLFHLQLQEKCTSKKISSCSSGHMTNNATTYCYLNANNVNLADDCYENYVRYCDAMPHQCEGSSTDFEKRGFKFCVNSVTEFPTSSKNSRDHRSPISLQEFEKKEKCKMHAYAQEYEPVHYMSDIYASMNMSIEGFACSTNESLSFIALDSLQYYHYAEKLGIDLLKNRHKSAAVILSDRMESHFLMDQPLTMLNLKYFVTNFTQYTLPRALKSLTSITSKNTHSYLKLKDSNKKTDNFIIEELSSDNFLSTIHQTNKAVMVFYYSKQCSFCNGIAYRYLTAAKSLSGVEDIVFTRIDGDLNLLPWEFTMEDYPTILFVPALRKSETRVFPTSLPITVPNLLGFVLANLRDSLKLEAMWHLCKLSKFPDEKTSCTASVRMETLSLTEKLLHQWRVSKSREKNEIFRKLQNLKHLHLLFAHSPNQDDVIKGWFAKLKSIDAGIFKFYP